jgi:uncharacterized membrane protein YdjX (TVP38/TMEM64 family)
MAEAPGADPAVATGERRRWAWVKLALLVAIPLLIGLAIYESGLIRYFSWNRRMEMLRFIRSLGPWGFTAFIFLQALQVIVAPIPGEVTGFLGGYLYGPVLGTLLSTIGLTIGSTVAFALTRALGRPFVERFVDRKSMERFDFLLHHKGVFLVFLIFLIPGFPKDIFCYILGLGHLTMLEFFVIATVGRFFGTVLLTLGGNYLRLHQYGHLFTLAGVAIVVVFLSILFRGRLEAKFREWHLRHHKA